jgi:hypothetical protein
VAFALWIDGEQALAQGLHEYRPMGVAVIALTDRFRPRDFSPRRKSPSRDHISYAGLFASLGEVNARLTAILRSQGMQKNRPRRASPTPPWI